MGGFQLRLGISYSWSLPPAPQLLFQTEPYLVRVPPFLFASDLFRCLSPDGDGEQLNLEMSYGSPSFSQILRNSTEVPMLSKCGWVDG